MKTILFLLSTVLVFTQWVARASQEQTRTSPTESRPKVDPAAPAATTESAASPEKPQEPKPAVPTREPCLACGLG